MAQITIPESLSRTLYSQYFGVPKDFFVFDSLTEKRETFLKSLPQGMKLVVKPDHAIGGRGKSNLIGLNLDIKGIETYLKRVAGTEFKGKKLHRFVVVPFVEHGTELYASFQTEPDHDVLIFSEKGGVEIESNWASVKKVKIGLEETVKGFTPGLEVYFNQLLAFFRHYNFAFLEVNPLTTVGEKFVPLDFKARLDSCAFFELQKEVDLYTLTEEVSEFQSHIEKEIARLDALSGASLKLKLLNPAGRIWPMVAGGGASIIYFDSLVDKKLAREIAFYGEYSGNPSFEMTAAYAEAIVKLMLKSPTKGKVLLLGGANANFTDIAVTFKGIMKVLSENATALKKQEVKILVRRGGPNVEAAFKELRTLATEKGLNIIIEGVEQPLPHILTAL